MMGMFNKKSVFISGKKYYLQDSPLDTQRDLRLKWGWSVTVQQHIQET